MPCQQFAFGSDLGSIMQTRSGIQAGPIRDNNPLCGLCDRVAIQAKRIFDGCVTRFERETFDAQLVEFSFVPVPPLRFLSAFSTGEYIPVRNLVITDTDDRGISRVAFDIHIPTTIQFEDSTGQRGTARAFLDQNFDILMRVPQAGLQPYTVESIVNLESLRARFEGTDFVALTCCVVAITRIVGMIDILIPTYGLIEYQECDSQDPCQMLFNTPFFSTFGR
ncbi:MAG: hypothetical protein LBK70_01350 [Clostridiales bacterium]|jgi:hypothetical protein|nr:hypothetical protein [Clostridiales bacterium]